MRVVRLSLQPFTLLAVCAVLLAARFDANAEAIKLSPKLGPPTTAVAITGTKFGKTEAVDVYFDTTDTLLVVTNALGSFSQNLDVPTAAQPGVHFVTAVGRKSGLAAQASFTVRTSWAQFRNGVKHQGLNPVENVLDPANVAGLNQAWAGFTGAPVASSPAVGLNGVVYVGSFDGNLFAFNATTGALLPGWPVSTGGESILRRR